jgi:hypothetical protein
MRYNNINIPVEAKTASFFSGSYTFMRYKADIPAIYDSLKTAIP